MTPTPERESFLRLPLQIVVGLVGFVLVVLAVTVVLAFLNRKSADRATERSICRSVIDTAQSNPTTMPSDVRARLADAVGKQRDISGELAARHSEYVPITDAIGRVQTGIATGKAQFGSLSDLLKACAQIGS